MVEDKRPLPTGEHIARQYRQMRPLIKVMGWFNRDIARQAKELEAQFENVERMKKEQAEFARRFAQLGWTIYDRLSVDIVRRVVAESDDEVAEQILAAHHLDPNQLQFLGYRFKVSRFEAWQELYERAVERAHAEDYLSAVPLVLIIIDGICTTKTGKHPFSGGADAPIFDSQTSGSGGIAEGLAILGATRRKLDTTPIRSPYRHGILHGLNPSFGNALVAAKAFNLLQTSVDYFDRREDEGARIAKAAAEQRQPSWSELAEQIGHTREMQRQLEGWRPRPKLSGEKISSSKDPRELDPNSPEATAAAYLAAITSQNFGEIAKSTIDYPLRSIGYRAGRHRKDLGELRLTAWEITGLSDEAPAISEIAVKLKGTYGECEWSGEQVMRLIYGDAEYNVLTRGASDGQWSVMPNFVPNLWATALRSMKGQDISDQEATPTD